MKKIFFALPCIAAVAIATFVGTKTFESNASEQNALVLSNVEALCSDNENGSGITIFRVCSKKPGKIFCSDKRGNRKWAIDVTFKFHGANDNFVCEECEDEDYDYMD